jgi:peptidylprolyl isomerase|tara:strand:- start:1792 stop:2142 length:351 start_codon:yes stop_codon:yes gene_type:complete
VSIDIASFFNFMLYFVVAYNADADGCSLFPQETTVVPKTRNVNIEGGGGLFIGASGPRPPPVIFIPEVLAGMRTGGRRTIMVSPDVGYEDIGEGEIPPGASFKLEVELLQVKTVAS